MEDDKINHLREDDRNEELDESPVPTRRQGSRQLRMILRPISPRAVRRPSPARGSSVSVFCVVSREPCV